MVRLTELPAEKVAERRGALGPRKRSDGGGANGPREQKWI